MPPGYDTDIFLLNFCFGPLHPSLSYAHSFSSARVSETECVKLHFNALVSLASVLWIALCRMMQFPKWKASADGLLLPGLLLLPERMPTSLPPFPLPLGGIKKKLCSLVHTLVFGGFCSCAFLSLFVSEVGVHPDESLWMCRTVVKNPEVDECAVFIEETAALKLQPPKFQGEFSLVHWEKWCCLFSSLGGSSM